MAYSLDSSQDSCYPGTTVLINRLCLHSQALLDEAERIAVTTRAAELESAPPDGAFTFSYYCQLHQHLFQDLYDWAGHLRTVNLTKKGTRFCPASELEQLGNAKFQWLQSMNELRGLQRGTFIRELADFYNELNLLHPFREGNGRTQRLFFSLLIQRAGYKIDFARCDADFLMISTIQAAQGVLDYLEQFFDEAVSK